mgnify:CR=1 FL=1
MPQPEEKLTTIKKRIPLGQRFTTKEEIANTVAFLLSEKLVAIFSGSASEQPPDQIAQILESYAQSRKADRAATIGLTDFMARVFTSNLAPVVIARGLALSALQWLPPAKTALARQMMFGRR